jgi:hypothetical protein
VSNHNFWRELMIEHEYRSRMGADVALIWILGGLLVLALLVGVVVT